MTPLVAVQGVVPDSKPGLPTTFVPSQPAALAGEVAGPATRPAASASSAAHVLFLMVFLPGRGESAFACRSVRRANTGQGCAKNGGREPARAGGSVRGFVVLAHRSDRPVRGIELVELVGLGEQPLAVLPRQPVAEHDALGVVGL